MLAAPDPFIAVGHHYQSFTQVDDAQVLGYLKAANQSQDAHVAPGGTVSRAL